MSTFFKSAAMTLLSRALQTLLYKYLSEVDVEGVNLPSLYNSDGHSGWGVRLSKVKLREGAKLMDLPGKPPQPRQRRRQRHKERDRPDDEPSDLEDPTVLEAPAKRVDPDGLAAGEAATVDTPSSEQPTEALPTAPPAPPPPPARRSSSWFSWYSRTDTVEEEEEGELAVLETPTEEPPKIDENENDPSENDPLVGSLREEPAVLEQSQHDASTTKSCKSEHADEEEGEDFEKVDEDVARDQFPLVLRLGKGGHIGTLDVRLVGKDIHVYVEDACLTIEAVRLAPNMDEDAEKDKATPRKDRPAVKPLTDPQTVGERVLAENGIARALSAFPNLFLRDIQIKVVIRDQVVTDKTQEGDEVEIDDELGPGDSVLEFNIELLSVTDGEDFLAKFRGATESSEHDEFGGDDIDARQLDRQNSVDPYSGNDFLVKRIRTGRGPEGGVSMRIYPPTHRLSSFDLESAQLLWARHRWESETKYCFLRCSGLDATGRIFLGNKAEMTVDGAWFNAEYYDDYDVDSMLFGGVDYIAPGPQPPLPPIASRDGSELADIEKFWTHEGATIYQTDDNGIQHSAIDSSFHRVARGLLPSLCNGDHLPCETCARCWTVPPGTKLHHVLDSSTPMAGLVLSVVTRDPLEINVDRPSLEVLGDVVNLFKKKAHDDVLEADGQESGLLEAQAGAEAQSAPELIDYSERSALSVLSTTWAEEARAGKALSEPVPQDLSAEDLSTSFPSYMQPEKIQILGIHLSDVVFRVHVMKDQGIPDEDLSFCYWDIEAKCVTLDHQKLTTAVRPFQDVRFDVGLFIAKEFKGPDSKQLVSMGLRQKVVEFDEMTIETLRTREEMSNRPPWPSTAAALLDVQPPLETLAYEERDRHAIQFRYFHVTNPFGDYNKKRAHAYVRIGPASVDTKYEMKDQLFTMISEARCTALGPPPESVPISSLPLLKSLIKYKVQFDGGSIKLDPKMEVRMPLSQVTGEKSTEYGLSFETLLDHISFSFGQRSPEHFALEHGLTLQQLAELPEKVRLGVLLFLPDLGQLEKALCIRAESNSFLRCSAVNKGLVKIAKRAARRERTSRLKHEGPPKAANRRQELMSELLKMDDDTLEELVMLHRRYNRRSPH